MFNSMLKSSATRGFDHAKFNKTLKSYAPVHWSSDVMKETEERVVAKVTLNSSEISQSFCANLKNANEEGLYVEQEYTIAENTYKVICERQHFSHNLFHLIGKGLLNVEQLREERGGKEYYGIPCEYIERVLGDNEQTIGLFSSELMLKFFELCDGKNRVGEEEGFLKYKEQFQICLNNYLNAKMPSIEFHQSMLSILIQAYAKHKEVSAYLSTESKNTKINRLLRDPYITAILKESNLVVTVDGKALTHSLLLPNFIQSQDRIAGAIKAEILQINTVANTINVQSLRSDYINEMSRHTLISDVLKKVFEYNEKDAESFEYAARTDTLEREIADIFDALIVEYPALAYHIKLKYEYEPAVEVQYTKFSKEIAPLFYEIAQVKDIAEKDGVYGIYSGGVYLKQYDNLRFPHENIKRLAQYPKRFEYLLNSGIIDIQALAECNLDQINLLLSPLGQEWVKCIVKSGNLDYFCKGILSVTIDTLQSMCKDLKSSDNHNIKQFINKPLNERVINAADSDRIAVFKDLISDPEKLEALINRQRFGLARLVGIVAPERKILGVLSSSAVQHFFEDVGTQDKNKILYSPELAGIVEAIVQNELVNHTKGDENKRNNLTQLTSTFTTCKNQWKAIQNNHDNFDKSFVCKLDALIMEPAMQRYSNANCKMGNVSKQYSVCSAKGGIQTSRIEKRLSSLVKEVQKVEEKTKEGESSLAV